MTKKLTQAVFEGLPSEYLWVAVDADGKCYAFGVKPMVIDDAQWISNKSQMFVAKFVGHDYAATDWQNSLIERDTGITVSEENQALAEQEHKNIAERLAAMKATIDEQVVEIAAGKAWVNILEATIDEQVVEIAAGKAWVNILEATIDEQAAEIEALKESQSDLRGFLHEQIEKNFELLNRQKCISVADQLPPEKKGFLSWNGSTVQLLQAAHSCNVGWYKSHDPSTCRNVAHNTTHWQPLPVPPEGV